MFACSRVVSLAKIALAQFTPALLQNNSYWGDGKAEFNIYDAQIARYGIPRPCEVLHILVREPFDPKQFVKPEGSPRPETIAVLKLNQILHVPTGLYVYQQMHSNFWRVDNAKLLKFSLTSNDSCGNTYKEARRTGDQLSYEYHTYWDGMAEGKENIALPPNGYFYDELPWLVRTLDFSKPTGGWDVQLAGLDHQFEERHHRVQAGEDFIQVDRENNRRCRRARGRRRPFHSRSRWPYICFANGPRPTAAI